MINISPSILGGLRALGILALLAILGVLHNAANLSFLSPTVAGLVVIVAGALEQSIASRTGAALFGAVKA